MYRIWTPAPPPFILQRVDSAIHQINHYPVDRVAFFFYQHLIFNNLLDSASVSIKFELSSSFEQPKELLNSNFIETLALSSELF